MINFRQLLRPAGSDLNSAHMINRGIRLELELEYLYEENFNGPVLVETPCSLDDT